MLSVHTCIGGNDTRCTSYFQSVKVVLKRPTNIECVILSRKWYERPANICHKNARQGHRSMCKQSMTHGINAHGEQFDAICCWYFVVKKECITRTASTDTYRETHAQEIDNRQPNDTKPKMFMTSGSATSNLSTSSFIHIPAPSLHGKL